ncbi:MAG TPA: SDR family oxidoreductase, partial [Bacteroidales bacterium]
ILEKISTIDILVNNAGFLVVRPFSELTDDDFDKTFSVNVKSVFKITRDLLPYFSANAHIVNISSMGGVQGSAKFPGLSLYSSSKGALGILTECLAEELKERKISVNALALGAVQTEMLAEAFPGYKAPLSASEMADFIYNFTLTGNKFFNGKILPVSSSTP